MLGFIYVLVLMAVAYVAGTVLDIMIPARKRRADALKRAPEHAASPAEVLDEPMWRPADYRPQTAFRGRIDEE